MMSFVDGAEIWFEPYTMSFYQKFYWSQIKEITAMADIMEKAKAQVHDSSSGPDFGNQRPLSTFSYESTKDLLEGNPQNPDAKFIFVKDMAYAIHGMYDFLPQKVPCKYAFLIRHPYRFVPSYLNMMEPFKSEQKQGDQKHDDFDPLLQGGRDQILALWKHVRENIDPDPIVIDADEMLMKPGEILPKFFDRLGIPWKDSYLNWNEDTANVKSWINATEFSFFAKNIHVRAMASSHFVFDEKPLPDINDMNPDAIRLVNMFMPGYEEMYKHALK